MENTRISDKHFFTDLQASVNKFKFMTILAFGTMIFIAFGVLIIAILYIGSSKKDIRIIDKQGYSYSSQEIDEKRATQLQMKAFVLNFIKLAYAFDQNNIQNNLNRAVNLADGSFSAYVQKHTQPQDIYQLIKIGSIATINEQSVINAISLQDNAFNATFTQTITGNGLNTIHSITINGKIGLVTPNGIDNPNGFLISNFIETYNN